MSSRSPETITEITAARTNDTEQRLTASNYSETRWHFKAHFGGTVENHVYESNVGRRLLLLLADLVLSLSLSVFLLPNCIYSLVAIS